MKYSKELLAGFIAVLAIVMLVFGINFLKGYSLFGGDDTYTAYFPNSAQVMVSANVTLNGVVIGKILNIENVPTNPVNRRVKIIFSVSESNIKLPKGSVVELGSLDLLSKGLSVIYPPLQNKGFYAVGSEIPGRMSADMFSQVKQYADPISQKIQSLILNIDGMVNSLSGAFDGTEKSGISSSIKELKSTIHKIGVLAEGISGFVGDEKVKFERIMDNVDGITLNLKKGSDQLSALLGDAKKVTENLVSTDFKRAFLDAENVLKKVTMLMEEIEQGNGTIGKLLNDEKLYDELVETNNDLQALVKDLKEHPDRYVHFSLIDKDKLKLDSKERNKLYKLLDSIPE